ncbi:unnamed protein product [Urochloa humidicola]
MAALSSSGERRPWADLPADLLSAVADHLDLLATTRLAAVCTSWARAVAADASLPLGTPCLLRDYDRTDPARRNGDRATFQLLDLTRTSGDELSFPAVIAGLERRRVWVGGKDGWLATVDQCTSNAQLVNAYTGEQVDLPDICTVPGARHFLNPPPPYVWERIFRRIVVCTTPCDASGYLAIAMLENIDTLAVTRVGSMRWISLEKPSCSHSMYGARYTDVIAHKGKVVAVTRGGEVHIWDIRADNAPPELVLPAHQYHVEDWSKHAEHQWKLAESADGRRLLLVCTYGSRVEYKRHCRHTNTDNSFWRFQAQGVHLFERDLDATAGDSDGDGWAPVTSLGDYSLFLGVSYPFMARVGDRRGLSSSDSECTAQVRANCVCVTAETNVFQRQELEHDMEVFRPTLKYYRGGTTEEFGSHKTGKGLVKSVWNRLINLTGIRDLFSFF